MELTLAQAHRSSDLDHRSTFAEQRCDVTHRAIRPTRVKQSSPHPLLEVT